MKFMDANYRLFTSSSRNRGFSYFQGGHVHELKYQDLHATATVTGEKVYKVDISFNKNSKITKATCTCPYYHEGYCKHIAATLYELDYEKKDDFFADGEGEELLSHAEKFCKECYNESYRITYDAVPDFYERKEKEILERSKKWNEDELISSIDYLYALKLPMAVGKNSYSRYLSFMKGKDFSLAVKKATFLNLFSSFPYHPFLKEAISDPEFQEVVNEALGDNIKESNELRDTIIYNLEEVGPYLSEDNLMGLLKKTGPYAVNTDQLLEVFIKRDFEEGIEEIASSYYLGGDALLSLANHYEKKGDKEKARAFYKSLLGKSRDFPFSFFVSYWKSLSMEEKLNEYQSLHEAARKSKHDKAFSILVGSGKKSDLRGLTIDDFLALDEEVKAQFPEEYLPILLEKTEKKLAINNYTQLDFSDGLILFEEYPLLFSSLIKKRNPKLMEWFTQGDKRCQMLILLREYGLLKEMHIHPYGEVK